MIADMIQTGTGQCLTVIPAQAGIHRRRRGGPSYPAFSVLRLAYSFTAIPRLFPYQIVDAINLPQGATRKEVLVHMHQLQPLTYLKKKVEKFNPSLVDSQFTLQRVAAFPIILSACIGVRTFLNIFISGRGRGALIRAALV
jgi:hypothetical protein